jgi:hypothetical protein
LTIISAGVAVAMLVLNESRNQMRRMLLVCTVLLGISSRASAQAAIDLLPQDAIVSIAVRDLDDLMKKGDKFLTDSEIRMPVRPSELFDQGT